MSGLTNSAPNHKGVWLSPKSSGRTQRQWGAVWLNAWVTRATSGPTSSASTGQGAMSDTPPHSRSPMMRLKYALTRVIMVTSQGILSIPTSVVGCGSIEDQGEGEQDQGEGERKIYSSLKNWLKLNKYFLLMGVKT